MSKKLSQTINAMTVDVEDFFQVSAWDGVIDPKDWSQYQPRVADNTYRLLDLFEQHQVKATFFMLGWVGEKFPQLIKDIDARGHEVASHGFAHRRASEQSREVFTADVRRSKDHLEQILGKAVLGYRAPSFSIGYSNEWAFEVLTELGFKYSSSTYPVKHDLYGTPDWPRFAYLRPEGITEIPIPTFKVMGKQVAIGGGGYFRLYPYWLTRSLVTRYLKAEKQPYSFYFHPWEIDPEQPKVEGGSWKSHFRHYINLKQTYPKLEKILQDFHWSSMQDVYGVS